MANANSATLRRVAFGFGLFIVFALASGFSGCPVTYNNNPASNYGAVVASPNPLTMGCTGTFSVTQAYYAGPFSTNYNASLITVTPTASPAPNSFAVAPMGGSPATVPITLTGAAGLQGIENVALTGCTPCVRHHDMWGSAQSQSTTLGSRAKECPLHAKATRPK